MKDNKLELKDLKIEFPNEEIVRNIEGLHTVKVELKERHIYLEYYVEYFRLIEKFVAYDLNMQHVEFCSYEDVKLIIEEDALNDIKKLLNK